MNTRGSIWNKWDLHIHSTASDGNGTCKEIIRKAKESGLAGIALTDHHTTKNIDEIKEEGKKAGINVISGIEFRSEYGAKSVHLIGLFPDEINGIKLDGNALTELVLDVLGIPETIIVAKGKEKDASSNDEKAFKDGMFLVQVEFKKAADLIHKYGGLVVVHAGTKENGIEDEMKHSGKSPKNTKNLYDSLGTVKEELLINYVDICEIRKEEDDEIFYLEKYNKPSISASDAHDFNDIGSKYVWIKADTTFDGLRQITFEPKDRVRICENEPEKKNDYLVIDRIEMKHDNFGEQVVFFNQNLNSIIGGRSSGKSILLGAIAKKIGTDKEVKVDKPEYNQYIENDIVPSVIVAWRDGVENTKRKIDYFPQSYINSLAANSDDIISIIEGIIKTDDDKKAKLEQYTKNNIANRAEINDAIAKYFQLLEKVKETKARVLEVGSKEGIKKEIQSLEKQIASIKEKMTVKLSEKEELDYKAINNLIDSSTKMISEIDLEIEKLKNILDIEIFGNISEEIKTTRSDISSILIIYYKELKKEFKNKWNLKINEFNDKLEEEKKRLKTEIDDKENSDLNKKCKLYYSENQSYTDIDKKLKAENNRLQQIKKGEEEIAEISTKLNNKKKEIIDLHNKYYSNCQNVSSALNFTKEDVQIISSIKFKNDIYSGYLASKFNQRAYEIQEIVNYEYEDNNEYLKQLDIIFDRVIDNSIPLKSSSTTQQAIIDIFTNSYYEISYDVLYDKDKLSQMSEGKKAFIIMRMLLDFNENGYPILIDQPEDDLDNRAIYDDLVKYIRTKKLQRQIIIVTHNPNIVVGGDSELVICANQDGIGNENTNRTKFEYFAGSLENTKDKIKAPNILLTQGIREHVCDILEGGNEAFIQREHKYRINKNRSPLPSLAMSEVNLKKTII